MDRLLEAATLSAPTGDGKWRVRYIAEGVSKNGVKYTGTVLKDFGNAALPKGTRMLANHDESIQYTGGDVNKIAGKTLSAPEYIPGDGLWGTVQIRKGPMRDFVDEFHDQIGLSVNVAAKTKTVGRVREAVTLEPDPYNSIDIVIAPSAGGKFSSRLVESYKKISGIDLSDSGSAPAATDSRNEREKMEEKDFRRLLEAALSPLLTRLSEVETKLGASETLLESVKTALPEKPETATLVSAFEAGKKVRESGLPESVQTRLMESFIASPADIDSLVAAEVAIRDEYLKESRVIPTTVPGAFESARSAAVTPMPKAWSVSA